MNNLRESLFWMSTDIWDNNIIISARIDTENFELKIVNIFVSLVWWSPRTTLRVKKVTMFKSFICNLFRTNIKLEGTWSYSIGRVNWTIINCPHWIYTGTVRKATYNNPNSLEMYRVSIIQFHSCLGWDKHRKVWHEICDCNIRSNIFMKHHIRYCINFWRSGERQSSLKHLEVNI